MRAASRAIAYLRERNFVKGGQQVAIVQSGREPIWRSASTHAIQVGLPSAAAGTGPCRQTGLGLCPACVCLRAALC